MDISELTLKLIIILIPGVIGTIIVERLTVHKNWLPFKFVLNTILMGAITYFVYQIFYYIPLILNVFSDYNYEPKILKVWTTLTQNNKPLPFIEILIASVLSIFIGYFATAIIQHKVIYRIAKIVNASKKFGDESLYSYFLTSDEVIDVYIRNIKQNLTYHGVVVSYSENDRIKEIVLRDVRVYKYESSEILYQLEKIYLSLHESDIIIEVPKIKI